MHGFALTLFGVIPRILLGTAITLSSITHDWKYMLMLTFIGMIGQYSLERALKLDKNTSAIAIFFSLGVVYTFLFDMLFFGKPFVWRKFWGCSIVIASIVVIFHSKK